MGVMSSPVPAHLHADCSRCAALCCTALPFAASADFAADKPAGTPCRNLRDDFRCGIHGQLRESGYPGCTVYDCFGAGQQVVQVTFGGRDWRRSPDEAARMFAVFPVMRTLHELLWYLTEARALPQAAPLHDELDAALAATDRLTRLDPAGLVELDVEAHRREVSELLLRVSERARPRGRNHRGADLVGAALRGADLRGANLRGALLVGADLREADLRGADLIGADLRGADLAAANLTGALFLTQAQLAAARGDARTALSEPLVHPAHWPQRAEPARRRRRRR
ncbi:uncharacterized protein YjbI with pentapeptide repeats [Pseudonocardia kunmingensis]|uniref:Uncharacterized protein YjbI with pentapeptide repeats n=2 Tax=Pseudonocardia kunmingensis TaxID=630975 RepID=A0A543DWZ1_9PSEU|nr:uncharacterized protein YjbI with pentapeptide repeats [Pseudonocardia kunmingensis]